MKSVLRTFADKTLEPAHNALRIVAGFLFMQHGVQKLFGWLSESPNHPVELLSAFGAAGVLETFGGALMILGLFTRPVGFILSGLMAVAYFRAHAPQGFWPIQNQGELAALYSFVWLYFFAKGGGRFSLDRLLSKRKS